MTNPTYARGLTGHFPSNERCNRCDFPLELSTYKGVKVVFNKAARTFLCIKCSTRENKKQNVFATIQDLDNFVNSNSQLKQMIRVNNP